MGILKCCEYLSHPFFDFKDSETLLESLHLILQAFYTLFAPGFFWGVYLFICHYFAIKFTAVCEAGNIFRRGGEKGLNGDHHNKFQSAEMKINDSLTQPSM